MLTTLMIPALAHSKAFDSSSRGSRQDLVLNNEVASKSGRLKQLRLSFKNLKDHVLKTWYPKAGG